MKYLLDTNILIRWFDGSKKFSKKIQNIIFDPSEEIFISSISFVEIYMKSQLGKLSVPQFLQKHVEEENFQILLYSDDHALAYKSLPNIHFDPFDRMIISQAIVEQCTIITSDRKFEEYDISIIS